MQQWCFFFHYSHHRQNFHRFVTLCIHEFFLGHTKWEYWPLEKQLMEITGVKTGSYFLRMRSECWRHTIRNKYSQQFSSGQLTCEYRCERAVVTSNSLRICIHVRMRYELGLSRQTKRMFFFSSKEHPIMRSLWLNILELVLVMKLMARKEIDTLIIEVAVYLTFITASTIWNCSTERQW